MKRLTLILCVLTVAVGSAQIITSYPRLKTHYLWSDTLRIDSAGVLYFWDSTEADSHVGSMGWVKAYAASSGGGMSFRLPLSTVANGGTTVTPNVDSFDVVGDTAIVANVTLAAPIGTPAFAQELTLYLRAISTVDLTWNSSYDPSVEITLPDSIHAGKEIWAVFRYNGAGWSCLLAGESP